MCKNCKERKKRKDCCKYTCKSLRFLRCVYKRKIGSVRFLLFDFIGIIGFLRPILRFLRSPLKGANQVKKLTFCHKYTYEQCVLMYTLLM